MTPRIFAAPNRRRRSLGGWTTLSVSLAATVLLVVGEMPTGAAALTVGSGTVAVTPVALAASSSGQTLAIALYSAELRTLRWCREGHHSAGLEPAAEAFILPEGLCHDDGRLAAGIAPKREGQCPQSLWWLLAHDPLLTSHGSRGLSGFEVPHQERHVRRHAAETTASTADGDRRSLELRHEWPAGSFRIFHAGPRGFVVDAPL